MPIYGHMRKTWSFLAHKVAKYQYLRMKPILYHKYNSFVCFEDYIAETLQNVYLMTKNPQNKGKIALISDRKFFVV